MNQCDVVWSVAEQRNYINLKNVSWWYWGDPHVIDNFIIFITSLAKPQRAHSVIVCPPLHPCCCYYNSIQTAAEFVAGVPLVVAVIITHTNGSWTCGRPPRQRLIVRWSRSPTFSCSSRTRKATTSGNIRRWMTTSYGGSWWKSSTASANVTRFDNNRLPHVGSDVPTPRSRE